MTPGSVGSRFFQCCPQESWVCPKYLVCPRWVAGRVGSGSDLEVAVAQGEGVQGAGER